MSWNYAHNPFAGLQMRAIKQWADRKEKAGGIRPNHAAIIRAALHTAKLVRKLGKRIQETGVARVSVDELLRMSESVAPSDLLGEGGILMDEYFLSYGSITCRKKLNQMLQHAEQQVNVTCRLQTFTRYRGLTNASVYDSDGSIQAVYRTSAPHQVLFLGDATMSLGEPKSLLQPVILRVVDG